MQDWVQDAALERNRRLRNASLLQRASRGVTDKSLSVRLWLQIKKAAIAGQSWFVVSLAGEPVATRRGLPDPVSRIIKVSASESALL
jgi:chloride channel 3/4/5